jgi:ligand-binding sensor domain-containing protein
LQIGDYPEAPLEDRDGNLWSGAYSPGGGVYRYDGEAFQYLSQKEGLGAGGVPSVREDRSGNVRLGTTSGVFRFDGERFQNFTKDGWPEHTGVIDD